MPGADCRAFLTMLMLSYLTAASCQSRVPSRVDATQPASTRAVLERVAAVESTRHPWIDEIELRIDELGVASFEDLSELQLRLRASLMSPWERSAAQEVTEQLRELELGHLDEVELEKQVRFCREGAESSHASATRHAAESLRDALAELASWHAESSAAEPLLEIEEAEFQLDFELLLFDSRPAPQPIVKPLDVLAALASGGHLLDEPAAVFRLVSEHHPRPATQRTSARSELARAELASASRWPWLRFFEIGVQARSGEWFRAIEAQVAVSFPLGAEAAAEEERREALARSAEASAEAESEALAGRALIALATLNDYLDSADERGRLEAAAEAASEVAWRWGEERLEDPRRLARMLRSTFRARRELLEARHNAARAACDLLETSGIDVAEWPRR